VVPGTIIKGRLLRGTETAGCRLKSPKKTGGEAPAWGSDKGHQKRRDSTGWGPVEKKEVPPRTSELK